jgi:hypothetical protein
MGIGTSIFLIAVGAVLPFAVSVSASGFNINTVGLIVMVVGVIGLLISLFFGSLWTSRRTGAVVEERPVVRDARGLLARCADPQRIAQRTLAPGWERAHPHRRAGARGPQSRRRARRVGLAALACHRCLGPIRRCSAASHAQEQPAPTPHRRPTRQCRL